MRLPQGLLGCCVFVASSPVRVASSGCCGAAQLLERALQQCPAVRERSSFRRETGRARQAAASFILLAAPVAASRRLSVTLVAAGPAHRGVCWQQVACAATRCDLVGLAKTTPSRPSNVLSRGTGRRDRTRMTRPATAATSIDESRPPTRRIHRPASTLQERQVDPRQDHGRYQEIDPEDGHQWQYGSDDQRMGLPCDCP
jgi:hypothetical protein